MASRLLTAAALGALQLVAAEAPAPADKPSPTEVLRVGAARSPGALVDREGAPLSDRAFAERANSAQFVLLGADHHNACDLGAQLRLIDALQLADVKPVLGLEMVGVDQQGILDLFNARRIPAERLDAALNWQQNWSVDFEHYLPILQRAETFSMPVVGLNIPPYVAILAAEGHLDPETVRPRSLLPPDMPSLPRGEAPWLEEAQQEEIQFVAPFTPTVRSADDVAYLHLLRGSQMAFVARQAASRYGPPVVILAAPGYVANGAGIGDHLRTSAAASAILSVLPWRDAPAPDPKSGDVFFYCPQETP